MAQLDVKVNYSGEAAPVETLSDKQIVSANGNLTSDEFSNKDLLKLMMWASTSKQAKQKVRASKLMMVKIKQLVKTENCMQSAGSMVDRSLLTTMVS